VTYGGLVATYGRLVASVSSRGVLNLGWQSRGTGNHRQSDSRVVPSRSLLKDGASQTSKD